MHIEIAKATTRMSNHLEKINRLMESLDAATADAFNTISQSKTFSKGEFLLKKGQVCDKTFWLETGIVRKFYTHEEREITTEFFFKDDLATAFESYTLQQPSLESIQALTATVVNMTDYKAFQQLKKQSPQLQELDFLLTEYYALWLERKVAELHTLNATQRYALLLEKSPHVVQQVQLTHIASYLNVSLETLSRIRSKI
jgi:CRP-like cAMP-binding protein